MLHTSYRLAKYAGACEADYVRCRQRGEPFGYKFDTPIPLTTVLEHCGIKTATWVLRCVAPGEEAERDRIARLFACECAERVLPIFERDRPDDRRPREAIAVARRFAAGKASEAELAAAGAAAWSAAETAASAAWSASAASSAAWSAARAAARAAAGATGEAAAGAAEMEAQAEILRRLLDGTPADADHRDASTVATA